MVQIDQCTTSWAYQGHGLERVCVLLESPLAMVYRLWTVDEVRDHKDKPTLRTYDTVRRRMGLSYSKDTEVGDFFYRNDPASNRTRLAGAWARTILPDPIAVASYNGANQQLTLGGKSMTYDFSGNLETLNEGGNTTTYTWDVRNRLTGIRVGVTQLASFAYDATSRRATKTAAGFETAFQYDGADIVKEISGGATVNYLRGLGLDEPLARIEESGPTTSYVPDALGSPLALTDGTTGDVTTSYTYGPFGQTAVTGAPSGNAFQYTGRENDSTGLYYYRARYYDPRLARFLQEDPLGLAGGVANFYLYVGNSPTVYTDPLGLDFQSATRNFATAAVTSAAAAYVVGAAVGVATVASSPVVAVAAGAVAVGIVAYGSYQLGKLVYELSTGREAYTGRPLTNEEIADLWATTAGCILGGGGTGRGFVRGSEIAGDGWRVAPFGNRTGNPTGELPHYHRSIPDPSKPGDSLPGQGMRRHRPWDSRSADQSFRDRF